MLKLNTNHPLFSRQLRRSTMLILLLCPLLGLFIAGFDALAQTDEQTGSVEAPVTKRKKLWTVSDLLKPYRRRPIKGNIRYCQAGRWQPCVCWKDVAREVRYRPAVRECQGNAAIVLEGKYLNIFSVVVRDSDNRDRWPVSGFNGCTTELATSENPPAWCSAFKTQNSFYIGRGRRKAKVHCLGAPGYSPLFKRVVRATAKLADIPGSSNDPLARWCLRSPRLPLN